MELNQKEMHRFLSKIDKKTDDECWNWIGSLTGRGYGDFRFQGKTVSAHRLSYILYHGDIPAGSIILHSCDNPMCCNPKHLKAGTSLDNCLDMMSKGRVRYNALTPEKVKEIRSLYPLNTQTIIAQKFGITQRAVSNIVNGKRWSHV